MLFQLVTALLLTISVQAQTPPATPTNGEVKPDPIAVTPSKDQVPQSLILLGEGKHQSNHAFVMDKSTRTLSVWHNQAGQLTVVAAVPADFGRNGGAKIAAGDLKTPEGIYFFLESKERAELDFEQNGIHPVRAFTLNYPNFFDNRAQKSGWGIWLHDLPDTLSLWRGSKGCVVVRSNVIKKLAPYISLKQTPILIEDEVQYVSRNEAKELQSKYSGWLNRWQTSWQSKAIDDYMNHYSEQFKAMNMTKAQWRAYKDNLNKKYSFIKVGVTEPLMIKHRDQMIVRFMQNYESDKNSDFGQKTLYLSKSGDEFKIVSEEWAASRQENMIAPEEAPIQQPAAAAASASSPSSETKAN